MTSLMGFDKRRCLRRAMTLVRLWRLPLGEDSLTLRYRRRGLFPESDRTLSSQPITP
ncbi:MAG: hypothetical protein V7K48_12355 [Nostoc sp.]|uniref:hypothetical protein n=1 Tax=Nostoc sp. TaxID=1180 RepID=UPI002FFAF5FB